MQGIAHPSAGSPASDCTSHPHSKPKSLACDRAPCRVSRTRRQVLEHQVAQAAQRLAPERAAGRVIHIDGVVLRVRDEPLQRVLQRFVGLRARSRCLSPTQRLCCELRA